MTERKDGRDRRRPGNGGRGRGHVVGNGKGGNSGTAKTAVKPHAFPNREHLTGMDFLRVMAKGDKRSAPAFHLYFMPAEAFEAGVCVSRRLGGAVVRNRIKRVLREAIRLTRDQLSRPCHLVLVARLGADRLEVEQAKASLTELCVAARLTEPEPVQR